MDQGEGQDDTNDSGFIDTLFDLNLFNIRVEVEKPVTIVLDEGSENEDWDKDDLFDNLI